MSSRVKYPRHHGSPYDRGGVDRWYDRQPNPHCFKGPQGGPHGGTVKVTEEGMTPEEIEAYNAGYEEGEQGKVWD